MSGSLEGSGGIGGLLALSQVSTLTPQHAFYPADGNGNITMLINSLQLCVAKYRYDPFANTLSSSGPLAEASLYRFSSKEAHPSSGLLSYLYRNYDPSIQRWGNGDPAEELGFEKRRMPATLFGPDKWAAYCFVRNNPVNQVDPLGLMVVPCPLAWIIYCGCKCFPDGLPLTYCTVDFLPGP